MLRSGYQPGCRREVTSERMTASVLQACIKTSVNFADVGVPDTDSGCDLTSSSPLLAIAAGFASGIGSAAPALKFAAPACLGGDSAGCVAVGKSLAALPTAAPPLGWLPPLGCAPRERPLRRVED
eukprot:32725-Chlamydomonas_euryale.AAC.5